MLDRNQLEFRVMDGTHIRTNVKSKLIRDGLENIRISAWKTVAATGETMLSPAMLEVQHDGKIIHQQSDPYVRTMFNRDIEDAMRSNGDLEEASFCRLFREWHEAEDKAGIPAQERCERSLRLRDWLMNSYDADRFPPPTQYIKGIPRITYEGLVCSIDAHILLYAVVKGGTYNWRSVSTLVAENFMGELAERSQNNHGVPSGYTLPSDMSKISELHAMRLKPDRSFLMKTSKSRAYQIPDDISSDNIDPILHSIPEKDVRRITKVVVRDHIFDERRGSKGKHGKISKLNEKPKGVQPVRFHYKVDETKILPSVRLGITEETLKDCIG